jgi:hypothetical protein
VIHLRYNLFSGKVHSEEFMAGFLAKLQKRPFSGPETKITSPSNHASTGHHLEDVEFIIHGAGTSVRVGYHAPENAFNSKLPTEGIPIASSDK